MKVYSFTTVQPPHADQQVDSAPSHGSNAPSFDAPSESTFRAHDQQYTSPNILECVMCGSRIASSEPTKDNAGVYLCKTCFPFDPLAESTLHIDWMNEILKTPGPTDEASLTPTTSIESSPTSTPCSASSSAPSLKSESTTSEVSRKRRHTSEDKTCSNCGTKKTGMWRRDTDGNPLCNACGQHFKKFNDHRPCQLAEKPIKKRMRKSKVDFSSTDSQSAKTSAITYNPFQTPNAVDMYGGHLRPMCFPSQQLPEFLPPPPMHPGWNNPMPFPPPAPWAFKYPIQQYY
uniref:GATA-type domain-containing protein n=1 Tax=Panagrellus redivivus TaxID=6233 RepID=A0A7E4VQ56_PANRE